jgi:hypothetical protein
MDKYTVASDKDKEAIYRISEKVHKAISELDLKQERAVNLVAALLVTLQAYYRAAGGTDEQLLDYIKVHLETVAEHEAKKDKLTCN